MWWKRKPVTHAAALWMLVVAAAVLLGLILGYVVTLTNLRKGIPRVFPPKRSAERERLPTLFGTVTSVDPGGVIAVDSKQEYDLVLADDITAVTSLGGAPFDLSRLQPGALITATGKDVGGRRMLAEAIVVLKDDDENQ